MEKAKEQHPDERQRIFDERFQALTNGFGEACEQQNITTAFAIAIHPEEEHPLIFARGHRYDVAALIAGFLRQLKAQLDEELDIR